jgi:glycerate kinase
MTDRERPQMLIGTRPLIATESFGPSLPAAAVAEAIGRGLLAGGAPEPDLCPMPLAGGSGPAELRALLDAIDFDRRMRAARAIIVGAARLQERALAGSPAFEIATRARQAGVPAYGVTGENALEPFDGRMLDLQVIISATDARALTAAGRKLARLLER